MRASGDLQVWPGEAVPGRNDLSAASLGVARAQPVRVRSGVVCLRIGVAGGGLRCCKAGLRGGYRPC